MKAKNLAKKIFSLLIVFTMLLNIIPLNGIIVLGDDPSDDVPITPTDAGIHAVTYWISPSDTVPYYESMFGDPDWIPDDPIKLDLDFWGWFELGGTAPLKMDDVNITGDIDLYAKFRANIDFYVNNKLIFHDEVEEGQKVDYIPPEDIPPRRYPPWLYFHCMEITRARSIRFR